MYETNKGKLERPEKKQKEEEASDKTDACQLMFEVNKPNTCSCFYEQDLVVTFLVFLVLSMLCCVNLP